MSIENLLERLVAAAEVIAETVRDKDPKTPTAAATGKGKGKAAAKGKAKDKAASKKADSGDPPDKAEVRKWLQAVQGQFTAAVAKSLLKECGASTITQLDEKKYGHIIEMCKEKLGDDIPL